MQSIKIGFFFCLILIIYACNPDPANAKDIPYTLVKPSHFPQPIIPADNPLGVNKIELGRMLFYEKRISEDLQIACSNCHKQEFAFGSDQRLDIKVNHGSTTRNSSTLFNLAFTPNFFWDGRKNTLESTVNDAMHGEMNFNIQYVIDRLMIEQRYKDKFLWAFNTTKPTEAMVEKAIASFIRTMVSGNSKVDRGMKEGNVYKYLNANETEGKLFFESEVADCFHCHGDPSGTPMMTDNLMHNNGLDSFSNWALFRDPGFGFVSSKQADYGKFKTPPIRNLSYTAPYMHDGRIPNLDMVLGHYNNGVRPSATLDPNMKHIGGLHRSMDTISKIKAYILSFDDPSFIDDPSFKSPF